jgi:gliding motility-associated-like protein
MQSTHKRILILISVFLIPIFILSQNNTFYRKYNLPGMQGALQMEVTNDGGFIATGQHEGVGGHGDCDVYAYKLDVCGNIDWFKTYGTAAQEGGKSIFQMNDGSFLISGLYSGSSTYRAFNMKVDGSGNLIWIKRYNFEWMMYSIETSAGDIISVGKNSGSLFLIKTDNVGNLTWSRQITGLGDMGLWLDDLPNGDIMLMGIGASNGKDFSVARLNSTGAFIWSKTYGGTGYGDVDHITWSCKGAVDLTDNSVMVTAPTLLGGLADHNIIVSKLSLTDGSVIWANVYGGGGRDQSRDIVKYPQGYAIIGQTSSFPTAANPALNIFEALGEKDILLFSINQSGTLQWAKSYGGADRDKGIGVKYNNDNGFSISAFTTSDYFGNTDASFDPLFIKTDSVGNVGCQMHNPPLQIVNINLVATNSGSNQSITIASDVPSIGVMDYLPDDEYICQTCSSTPNFSISDTTLCINDSVYLSNTTIVGLTCFQQWNINGSFFDGPINPAMSFPVAGVYQIYLYSSCGINSDTLIRNIYVIDPQITIPDLICTSSAPVNFQANIAGGVWSGTNVSSSGIFNPGSLPVGNYYTTYTIPEYCAVSDSFILDQPDVYAGNDTLVCFGNTAVLNASSSDSVSYSWSVNSSNGSPWAPPAVGTYNLTVTVTDTNSCTHTDIVSIQSHPIPVADFTYVADCYSTEISFTSTSTVNNIYNDQLDFEWAPNGTVIPQQTSSVLHDYGSSGLASMTLQVSSQIGGCVGTVTLPVNVPTNPSADFTFVQLCDYIANLTGSFSNNEVITDVDWQTNNTPFGLNAMTASYAFGAAGDFNVTLTVTNDYPCAYVITKSITLIAEESLDEQTIPNVITPNSNGTNDVLNLDFWLDECLEYTMSIFNRWGNLVYEFSRYDTPFSGKDISDEDLSEGVYFYKLVSGMEVRHGHITVIR